MTAVTSSKPEMPHFSYAQAAKGLSSSTKADPSKAESTTTTSEKDSANPAASNSSSDVTETAETPREPKKTTPMNGETKSSSNPKQPTGTYSPSIGTTSTAKDDDSSSVPNGTSESTWDKQSQTSGTEKPGNAERSKDADKSVSPPKELKAAPLPTVNVWQQRREAQDAKAKAIETTKPAAVPPVIKAQKPAAPPAVSPETQQPQQQLEQRKPTSKKKGSDAETGSAKDRKKSDGGKGRDDGMLSFL